MPTIPTTVLGRVQAVVVSKLAAKEEDVHQETSFIEDLNADSLDLVELIMAFEEEFSTPENPIQIPDQEASEIKTIGEAVAWLEEHGVLDTVPTR